MGHDRAVRHSSRATARCAFRAGFGAAVRATVPAVALGATVLAPSCTIHDDLISEHLSVSGTLPLTSREPAHIYVVACRAGSCSEGPIDAQSYHDVLLGRRPWVECSMAPGRDPAGTSCWALDCSFDLDQGGLGEGACEQVWLEVRERPSWQLLVHFEHDVAHGALGADSDLCGPDSASRELHW